MVQTSLRPASGSLNILDAGCGTRLCAPLLKPWAKKLVGADLSPGMLEKAEERELYDSLHQVELTGFLQKQRPAYDLILAADVFCYFGDMEDVLQAAKSAMKPGGYLAFSLECKDIMNYELHASGRYSHSETYLRLCLKKVGLELEVLDHVTLRWEYGVEVGGVVVLARRK